MTKKCDKYESLFIFSDEKTLLEHVNECEDCKKEHEKMNRVSELIQEVKPLFKKQNRTKRILKVACVAFMMILSGFGFEYLNYDTDILDLITYGTTFTAEDLMFPTDEYGLIMVD